MPHIPYSKNKINARTVYIGNVKNKTKIINLYKNFILISF